MSVTVMVVVLVLGFFFLCFCLFARIDGKTDWKYVWNWEHVKVQSRLDRELLIA